MGKERTVNQVLPDGLGHRIKWGETRRVRVKLDKGTVVEDTAGTVTLAEDCWVDQEETWLPDPRWPSLHCDGAWREPKRDWSTLRRASIMETDQDQDKAPRLSWWRRWFGPRIPRAQVVKRG